MHRAEKWRCGIIFDMTNVADEAIIRLDTIEIGEFINRAQPGTKGMTQGMMQISHPVHLHGLLFRIIERDVSLMDNQIWADFRDGFIDQGSFKYIFAIGRYAC